MTDNQKDPQEIIRQEEQKRQSAKILREKIVRNLIGKDVLCPSGTHQKGSGCNCK